MNVQIALDGEDTAEKVAKITALTAQLGAVTADEIAQRIRESEVEKGERGTAARCPLALLFAKVLGFEVWVTSTRWSIPSYGPDGFVGDWEAKGDMPDSCVTFIDSIDAGFAGYADLVEDFDDDLDDIEFTDFVQAPDDMDDYSWSSQTPLSPKNEE